VTLAAKLLVLNPNHHTLGLLARYVFSLARYDQDYDVRDRARTLSSLLASIAPILRPSGDDYMEDQGGVVLRREQVRVILFEGKIQSSDNDPIYGKKSPAISYEPDQYLLCYS